ncbi:hypothetical protein [Halalkalibacter urbisdiaboli]|uniref:hypothetical protein n=1 Tax=Halalkalibacter urbisdiaboli TaxID=1960589 RepID=UPI000B4513C7|nr:hypothetical protein [Halalkalibacter urbisdiaboli]
MKFLSRFENIQLEIEKALVDCFIAQIKQTHSYKWLTKEEHHALVIGENEYELSFKEKQDSYILTIDELVIHDKIFSLTLSQLLFDARKKKMGIQNIYTRAKSRADKREEEIQVIQKGRNENTNKLALPASREESKNTKKLEIDYVLMDLHEALEKNDQEMVTKCKERLQQLVNENK